MHKRKIRKKCKQKPRSSEETVQAIVRKGRVFAFVVVSSGRRERQVSMLRARWGRTVYRSPGVVTAARRLSVAVPAILLTDEMGDQRADGVIAAVRLPDDPEPPFRSSLSWRSWHAETGRWMENRRFTPTVVWTLCCWKCQYWIC